MRVPHARATTGRVTTGARYMGEADAAWEAVRADSAIQFAPVQIPDTPPPEPPGWLEAIFRWLGELLAPVGQALGVGWPVVRWVLLGLLVLAVALLAWRIFGPMLGWRPKAQPTIEDPAWSPAADDALALLEDADRLAAEGRYDEATHLLLQRSVSQIGAARPGLVEPATTARELAAMGALPEAARRAFAIIAERVERSLFALRTLGADDWREARAAYAEFALARLGARV